MMHAPPASRAPLEIYLASPYTDPDPRVREGRFRAVCLATARLMADGHVVYSPIAHSHAIAELADLPTDWEFWAAQDEAFIAAAGRLVVLTLPGWEQSRGVAAELEIAARLGRPVVYMEPVEAELEALAALAPSGRAGTGAVVDAEPP